MINRSSSIPPRERLAGILRSRIEDGELQPGNRIPPVVSLAQEYDLAPGTVRKALTQLQRGGARGEPGWLGLVCGGEALTGAGGDGGRRG